MNIKIQGGGKDLGIHANKGSCINLVNYLEHEDAERSELGLEVYPFFSSSGDAVKKQEVLASIDGNHSCLHRDDAKFYMLTISPSRDEILAMGNTDEERVEHAKDYVRRVLDAYAANFHRDNIASHADIVYFYKLHFTRAKGDELEFHIQGVLSRKDASGKYKLSPMTNHRNTQSGPVQGGFDRIAFDRECERIFDEMFAYKRSLKESFDYCNTVKNGTYEEKDNARIQLQKEQSPDSRERAVMTSRMETIRQRKKDKFWNEYHSCYKPLLDKLKEQINASEQLYAEAWRDYNFVTSEISGKYAEMKRYYDRMEECTQQMKSARTAKALIKTGALLLSYFNPGAGVILGLLSLMVAESSRRSSAQTKRKLYKKIASVRKDIKEWKDYQEHIVNDRNAIFHELKASLAGRKELTTKLNDLRKQLEESMPKEEQIIWQTPGPFSLLSSKVSELDGECTFWRAAWDNSGDRRRMVWEKIGSFASAEFLGEDYNYAYFKVTDRHGNEGTVNQYANQVRASKKQGISR